MSNSSIKSALQKVLNSHGYGLHYAIIRKMDELLQDGRAFPWQLAAVELPVEVRGEHTRVDIVLKHIVRSVYIVCECKRVNPSLSEWAFVKAPYVTPPDSAEWIFAESVMSDGRSSFQTSVDRVGSSKEVFHVAVEVKSDKAGDQYGHGRGGIEGAATQVLRSVNGFVHFLKSNSPLLAINDPTSIVPVVFTTASLRTTNLDLGGANLENGHVDLADVIIQEVDWLYYQYSQSPGLRHTLGSSHSGKSIADILQAEFTRTIAVVNPQSLEAFFKEALGFMR